MMRMLRKLLLGAMLLLGGGLFAAQPLIGVPVASAQAGPDVVDAADYIDPMTGALDVEAYLAAVLAANRAALCRANPTDPICTGAQPANNSRGGTLPVTGSSASDFGALGVALVAVGFAAVVAARRTRSQPASFAPSGDS